MDPAAIVELITALEPEVQQLIVALIHKLHKAQPAQAPAQPVKSSQ